MNEIFDNNFLPNEKLYRAVYPPSKRSMFWKSNGEISSAAFYDPKGLSVERGNLRLESAVIASMKAKFSGNIISVVVGQCQSEPINAMVIYKPSRNNVYHSEIHGSSTVICLSRSQRKKLARAAVLEYKCVEE